MRPHGTGPGARGGAGKAERSAASGEGGLTLSPLWALAPALLAFLVRIPALAGGWVWDDLLIVRVQLGAFHSLRQVVLPPDGIIGFGTHYYRPLTLASFLLDHLIWEERPFGYHLTVLLAHAAACALLFLLLRSFLAFKGGSGHAALTASLLFSVHPIHTESVAWVAGRTDVLAAVMILASALALRARPLGAVSIGLSAGLFGAGCLFKEVAFAFLPFVLPVAGGNGRPWAGERSSGRRFSVTRGRPLLALLAFAMVAAGVLALRVAALGGLGGDAPRSAGGLRDLLQDLGGALAFYLPRAIVPMPFCPFVAAPSPGIAAWAGLAAGSGLALAGVIMTRRPAFRLAGHGILFFFAALGPSLVPALLRVSITPLAERYLYIPTLGLAAVIAGLPPIRRPAPASRRSMLGYGALGLVFAILAAISIARTSLWRDDVALWSAASERSASALPRIHLARALDAAGRHAEAEALGRKLLQGPPPLDRSERALVALNLGVSLVRQRRYHEAVPLLEESAALAPRDPLAWYNLANLMYGLALGAGTEPDRDSPEMVRSIEAIREAVRLAPLDPRLHLLRGRIELSAGEGQHAREALARAIALDGAGSVAAEARSLLSRIE